MRCKRLQARLCLRWGDLWAQPGRLILWIREVERPGEDCRGVDHHDLAMDDGMLVVDERLDTGADEECGRAVLLCLIGLVEPSEDLDPALVGIYQRFGNGR